VSIPDIRTNEDNPNPRVACVLLLDTSYSMSERHGADGRVPIDELNDGFALFCKEVGEDEYASKRTEVAVVTFGGVARVAIDFTEGRDLQPQRFAADGGTPMGAAIDIAIDEIARQKQAYKDAGLLYYRPWLFAISDGAPTDPDAFARATQRLRDLEAAKGINVFAVGVGPHADFMQLAKLSARRDPLALKGLSFKELFQWLSSSMGAVSQSQPPTGDGKSEKLPLPEPTWTGASL
jgi:uncharacterized protein YegL